MKITQRLFELADSEYGDFQARLTPGIERKKIIGVRVPAQRKLAKEYIRDGEAKTFLSALPHEYYDENMLHGLLISEIKDYDECINAVDAFLPYIDNWAVCDIMSPAVFRKHRQELLEKIREWISSEHTYTCRFGIEMLMSHFLDDDFKKEYLDYPVNVSSGEYYVNMMRAWFFATALAKQWEAAVPYIENGVMDTWTHNKTISKARESYRISVERKDYLKGLKK